MLEIERGRYTNPRTPIEERVCVSCSHIEDEKHFLTICVSYCNERIKLYEKICKVHPRFTSMSDDEKFLFMMTNTNPQILTWTSKFIHDAMVQRSTQHNLPVHISSLSYLSIQPF